VTNGGAILNEVLKPKVIAALALIFILISAADVIVPGRLFMPDESRFYEEAQKLADSGRFVAFGSHRAWEMPLTALIYVPFYKITGGGEAFIKSVRVVQAFVLMLTAIGAATIAFSIFQNRRAALIALFAVTIYPSFLAYQLLLLSETLFICCLVWGMAFLYLWDGKKIVPAAAVLAFTLALYTKAALTVMTPVLIVARCLGVKLERRRIVLCVIGACALFALCMSPWWARNWMIFGKFVPYTTSASWNLYLGNNPSNLSAGVDWVSDVEVKKVEEIFALEDELAISEAFMAEGRAYIAREPIVFLKNAWLKFKRFWNFTLNADSEKLPRLFRYYNIASIISWGPAFCFSIVSVWLNRRKWLQLLPIFMLIAYYTVVHTVVISSLRYRLPIEPFFLILGADGFCRFCDYLRAEYDNNRRARPEL
jgi:hypothetical protein